MSAVANADARQVAASTAPGSMPVVAGGLHEDDVGERGKRARAADHLGAQIGAAGAELEESVDHPARPARFGQEARRPSGETRSGTPVGLPSTASSSRWSTRPASFSRARAVRAA